MPKFKLEEQYHFGKLQEGGNKIFVRTPKPQIFTGRDLKKRQITTFAEYYDKNPSNFKEGDNISICTKNEHGSLTELMTKTILAPVDKVYTESLNDNGITPLHQQRSHDENKDLVNTFKNQIEYFKTENTRLQEHNTQLTTKTIDQGRELAELDVKLSRTEEKLKEKTDEYEKLWKEFGDLIKEARNPAPPSLGDRIGQAMADPEIMAMAKDGIVAGVGWLKSLRQNGSTQLNDAPPPHQEAKREISEDESEVFDEKD